jgi:hypothetical protein
MKAAKGLPSVDVSDALALEAFELMADFLDLEHGLGAQC